MGDDTLEQPKKREDALKKRLQTQNDPETQEILDEAKKTGDYYTIHSKMDLSPEGFQAKVTGNEKLGETSANKQVDLLLEPPTITEIRKETRKTGDNIPLEGEINLRKGDFKKDVTTIIQQGVIAGNDQRPQLAQGIVETAIKTKPEPKKPNQLEMLDSQDLVEGLKQQTQLKNQPLQKA